MEREIRRPRPIASSRACAVSRRTRATRLRIALRAGPGRRADGDHHRQHESPGQSPRGREATTAGRPRDQRLQPPSPIRRRGLLSGDDRHQVRPQPQAHAWNSRSGDGDRHDSRANLDDRRRLHLHPSQRRDQPLISRLLPIGTSAPTRSLVSTRSPRSVSLARRASRSTSTRSPSTATRISASTTRHPPPRNDRREVWEIDLCMTESDVETILQRAREQDPEARPRIISDNGPQLSLAVARRLVLGYVNHELRSLASRRDRLPHTVGQASGSRSRDFRGTRSRPGSSARTAAKRP